MTKKGNYFVEEKPISFISSGCTLLDLVLGGGYPLGRITNLVGDKSSGKCIKNAYLLTTEGMIKIDDIGKRKSEGQEEYNIELSVSKGNKAKTSHFWKEQVEDTIQVRTNHGYEIEGTFDHKIMVFNKDCTFGMKTLEALQEGDIIIIAKGSQFFPKKNKKLDIPNLRRNKKDHTSIDIENPKEVSEELARFFGYLVADGVLSGKSISLTNKAVWFKKGLYQSLKNCFNIDDIRVVLEPTTITYNICRKQLYYFVDDILGNPEKFTARYKYVPACILQSSKKVQASFLRALIDCDAWKSEASINYCTASKELADQIHLMLLNFGIIGNKKSFPGPGKYSNHTYHEISIYGKYLRRYLEEIGTDRFLDFKLDEIYNGDKSNFDTVPFLKEKMEKEIEGLKKKLGWVKNGTIKKHPGRFKTFHPNSNQISYMNINKFIRDYEKYGLDCSFYQDILNKEYHFDTVVKKKYVKEQTIVYDVHIPGDHLFWANGFINHNTLLAIEATANFHKKYPKGKIYYHEAEAAFDTGYAESLGMPIESVDFVAEDKDGKPKEGMDIVEGLYDTLVEKIELHKNDTEPCIYIVDSLDALSDKAEKERGINDGTYAMSKPKQLSQLFRRLAKDIERTKMSVIIISQIRDKIGISFGETKTRSGGRALDFYASQVLWLAEIGKLKKTVQGIERIYGVNVRAKCKKNKIGLPFRDCDFPIYFGYGVNSLLASLEFLSKCKKLDGLKITASRLRQSAMKLLEEGDIDEIIKIEERVKKVWKEIETSFLPKISKY